MKLLTLELEFDDNMRLRSVAIDVNTTGRESNSSLMKEAATLIIKSLESNKDSVLVQDMLNELNIKREKP